MSTSIFERVVILVTVLGELLVSSLVVNPNFIVEFKFIRRYLRFVITSTKGHPRTSNLPKTFKVWKLYVIYYFELCITKSFRVNLLQLISLSATNKIMYHTIYLPTGAVPTSRTPCNPCIFLRGLHFLYSIDLYIVIQYTLIVTHLYVNWCRLLVFHTSR